MGIDKKWHIRIGSMAAGSKNKISDVAGVQVGHCTLADGKVQTGVTVILPHGGNTFQFCPTMLYPKTDILECRFIRDDSMDILFRGTAEAVEEAVLSSLLHAETVTGKNGVQAKSLAEILTK